MFGINGNNPDPKDGGQAKEKGYKYLCSANCVYGGRYYRAGDVIVLPEKKEVPHFKLADNVK